MLLAVLFFDRRVAGAAVAKLAYAVGLKSTGVFPVVGSSPTSRTIFKKGFITIQTRTSFSIFCTAVDNCCSLILNEQRGILSWLTSTLKKVSSEFSPVAATFPA